jgi:hypothetical protein
MKKLLAIVLVFLFALGAIAQEDAQNTDNSNKDDYNMWLGGEVTFGAMSDLDFTFGPHFGIMVAKNMAVGGTLLFSSGNSAYEWGLEPYFRYYLPVSDRFSFYGDAYFGFGGGDTNTDIDTGDYNWLDFGVRAGLQFWFNSRWSMAASTDILNYSSYNNEGEFGAGVNFNTVSFALFFHF